MGKLGWFRFIPHIQIYTLYSINRSIMKHNKKNIKLFDNFDWAALGIAACGVVILINVIMGVM